MNYSITITTPAADLDLTEELKSHLRLNNGNSEDAELARFVSSAAALFEHETNRTLLPTTFKQWFPKWSYQPLELARASVISVEEVGYYDQDDNAQVLDHYHATTAPEGYRTDLTGVPGLVYLPNLAAPSLSLLRQRPVYVEFVAGTWANQAAIAPDVVLAILLLAGHLYNNRESHTELTLTELPMGFKRVCNKYLSGIGGM
jgi:uncharacterized phiE125 gp8 family phage protein